MANIRRRPSFIKGLPEELDARLHRVEDYSNDTDLSVEPEKFADRGTLKQAIDNAISQINLRFINDTVTIQNDSATLQYTPLGNTIFLGYAQVALGDGTFDLVICQANGNTLTLLPDTTGEYDGLQATVTYAYIYQG